MFGIPGKVVIKVVEIGLAKANDVHGVACEQRLVLDSSLLPPSFDLCTRFSLAVVPLLSPMFRSSCSLAEALLTC